MKRLAIMLALLNGCGFIVDHAAKHPIAYDVIDGALIIGASATAIADRQETARGVSLGVDFVALFFVPALVVATVAGLWRPN